MKGSSLSTVKKGGGGRRAYYFTVLYVVVANVATVGFEKNNKVKDHRQLLPRRHYHYHYHRREEAHKGFLSKIATMTARWTLQQRG
jgi:hypothetical protein